MRTIMRSMRTLSNKANTKKLLKKIYNIPKKTKKIVTITTKKTINNKKTESNYRQYHHGDEL